MATEKKNKVIFDKVREVPDNAKSPITSGPLTGLTNISPMWRIEKATELFGPAGEGWKEEILRNEYLLISGKAAWLCQINFFYRLESGEWSEPIPGTGMAVATRYVKNPFDKWEAILDEEAPKKAHTEAFGQALKTLGFGADVYYGSDDTIYSASGYIAGTDATSEPVSLDDILHDKVVPLERTEATEAATEPATEPEETTPAEAEASTIGPEGAKELYDLFTKEKIYAKAVLELYKKDKLEDLSPVARDNILNHLEEVKERCPYKAAGKSSTITAGATEEKVNELIKAGMPDASSRAMLAGKLKSLYPSASDEVRAKIRAFARTDESGIFSKSFAASGISINEKAS